MPAHDHPALVLMTGVASPDNVGPRRQTLRAELGKCRCMAEEAAPRLRAGTSGDKAARKAGL